MALKPFSTKLDEKLLESLDKYSKKSMIPKARILAKAIEKYLKEQSA